ncbi:hypothetical protein ACK3ZA_13110 [Aeromonas caviae]
MAKALMARLARLESLESVQMPTVIEYHRPIVVSGGDSRRGTYVIEGAQVTFYAASAAEYEEASARQAAGRNIIVISLDHRCLDFKH